MKRYDENVIPSLLYKYGDWGKTNDKGRLIKNELYFPSSLLLNDPFDRGIPWRYDLETEDKQKEHALRIAEYSFPELTCDQRRKKASEALREGRYRNPSYRREITENIMSKHGVLSLSARRDSTLMWSHYCNKHSGFCLGFSGPELLEYFRTRYNLTKRISVCYPVEYENEYPEYLPSEYISDPELFFARPITLKSIDWSYEEEWRFILMGNSNTIETYENYILKEVIVGAEATQETVEEIRDAIKSKKSKIEFLRCVRKLDDSGMDFETIEIE